MQDILTNYFDKVTKGLVSTLSTPDAYLNKMTLTLILIIISLLIYFLFKKTMKYYMTDFKKRMRIQTVIKSTFITITSILILFTWIQATNAIILVAIIIGVLIIVMARGLTNNIIAFIIIRYRKYFKIGHRIEINEIIGDVIELNLVSFKLLEVRGQLSSDANTGRIINLPNKLIFDNPIRMVGVDNTLIWHEIKYVLTFDSDWQSAEHILRTIGDTYFSKLISPYLKDEHKKLPREPDTLKSNILLDTNNDGIILILQYLVDYERATSIKTAL